MTASAGSTDEAINALMHMADDHECCRLACMDAIAVIGRLRDQRDALAEALREMRYSHSDKAERMAVAALSNVRDHRCSPEASAINKKDTEL